MYALVILGIVLDTLAHHLISSVCEEATPIYHQHYQLQIQLGYRAIQYPWLYLVATLLTLGGHCIPVAIVFAPHLIHMLVTFFSSTFCRISAIHDVHFSEISVCLEGIS